MKSLTLFRHAKTERDSATGRDFDRKLNERGRFDATRMGKEIRATGIEFDQIVSSPAYRAVETAELALLSPRFDERIYNASIGQLLAIVQEADEKVGRLMLVGHNPSFERLASRLVGEEIEMPTGALVEIDLPADHWREAGDAPGRSVRFIRPRDLD